MAHNNGTPRVKICGITREEDAAAAVDAGAHALGFVFYPPSSRYLTAEAAGSIIAGLPPFVNTVGVFVNLPREQVDEIAAVSGIDLIQLQGEEGPHECTGFSRPVIKVFRFSPESPLPDLVQYDVAGILIDTGVPGSWGGTGVPLDWHALREQLDRVPDSIRSRFILAGGLGAENVGEAIGLLRPYGVDVSSGVEEAPGKKSAKRIKEFIHAVQIAGRTEDVA